MGIGAWAKVGAYRHVYRCISICTGEVGDDLLHATLTRGVDGAEQYTNHHVNADLPRCGYEV